MKIFNKESKRLEKKIRELIQQHEIELRNLKEFYIDRAQNAYDKGYDKGWDSGYDSGYRDGQRERK